MRSQTYYRLEFAVRNALLKPLCEIKHAEYSQPIERPRTLASARRKKRDLLTNEALHAHKQWCFLFTPPPPLFTRVCRFWSGAVFSIEGLLG